jgi:transcriptional regulator with XRE-family HTH domain
MDAGLKQSEIGSLCGMATSTVSDIANGRIKEPGGDAALKLHDLHIARCAPKDIRVSA